MVANAKTSIGSAKTSLATAVLRFAGEDCVPAVDGSANTDIVDIKRRRR